VPAIVESIQQARSDLDGDYVFLAVEALRQLKDERAMDLLAEMGSLCAEVHLATRHAHQGGDPEVSVEARKWIQEHRSGPIIAALQPICVAIGVTGGAKALEVLRGLATHADEEVRRTAISYGYGYLVVAHPDCATQVIQVMRDLRSREESETVKKLMDGVIKSGTAPDDGEQALHRITGDEVLPSLVRSQRTAIDAGASRLKRPTGRAGCAEAPTQPNAAGARFRRRLLSTSGAQLPRPTRHSMMPPC
jgi:hypothetical protein